MPTITSRGADLLVRSLADAGVDTIFTLSGNHIMPIFDACKDAGIRLIHTRHEAAAVHMADAWARLTGNVGVALVTGGPGHANAVGALYTAAQAESPVVLLSGHAPLNQLGKGAFQEMAQADLAAPLTKASWTARTTDGLGEDMARAFATALSGRPGPVHVSLPTDLLDAAVASPRMVPREAWLASPVVPSATVLADMLSRMRSASRPLIVTGPALLTRPGRVLSAALAAATGVPVVGMESPRGTNDPCLGAFADMLAQADCVLLLGKRLDFTLKFGQAPALAANAAILQIDADDNEIARSRAAFGERLVAACVADAVSGAQGLMAAAGGLSGQTDTRPFATAAEHAVLGDPSVQNRADWQHAVHAAIAYRPAAWATATAAAPDRVHPAAAFRPLQALLDSHPDAVLVVDGGEIGQWAQACLSAPQRVINGIAGSIGSALPFAVAARLAVPDAPVVAVLGDGTFGFHGAEFDTAVRHGLPMVVVVGNDARWNAEYQIQVRDYGPDRTVGCELLPTRYDQVAAAFGGFGVNVTHPAAMESAVQAAVASGRPACINVMMEGLAAPTIRRG
ncbi:thiamine pyrophosphate-binding protein [Pigmentiphaga litoralis]|uniref:thiamine pyrophosphate-binding protein n=1 Tax=Pigmentiphaga litoralis TaxID=516702 RepID=UPI003B43BC34